VITLSSSAGVRAGRIDWQIQNANWSGDELELFFKQPVNAGDFYREYIVSVIDRSEEVVYWSGPMMCLVAYDEDGSRVQINSLLLYYLLIRFPIACLEATRTIKIYKLVRGLVMATRVKL
jgi:hypothetical protein